jgi:hypothetical protein
MKIVQCNKCRERGQLVLHRDGFSSCPECGIGIGHQGRVPEYYHDYLIWYDLPSGHVLEEELILQEHQRAIQAIKKAGENIKTIIELMRGQ